MSFSESQGSFYFYCLVYFRNYKSGYVWNDLSENDVVYPAEGYEYVLKASQLVDLHASCGDFLSLYLSIIFFINDFAV